MKEGLAGAFGYCLGGQSCLEHVRAGHPVQAKLLVERSLELVRRGIGGLDRFQHTCNYFELHTLMIFDVCHEFRYTWDYIIWVCSVCGLFSSLNSTIWDD